MMTNENELETLQTYANKLKSERLSFLERCILEAVEQRLQELRTAQEINLERLSPETTKEAPVPETTDGLGGRGAQEGPVAMNRAVSGEACREFVDKLHQVHANELNKAVWQMRLLLDEWGMERQSTVGTEGCWDQVRAKVNTLQKFIRLVDECNRCWQEAEKRLLEYQLNEGITLKQAGEIVAEYKNVLKSSMEAPFASGDDNDPVHYLVRQLLPQLQKEAHNKWHKARHCHGTLAESRTNAVQMAEAVVILKEIVEDNEVPPYVTFYKQVDGNARGVLLASEALAVARERLFNYWREDIEQCLVTSATHLQEGKTTEANRTLEGGYHPPGHDTIDLPLPADIKEKLDKQRQRVTAWRQARAAIEIATLNPVKAYDTWEAARKTFQDYLTSKDKEGILDDLRKKATLDWIEPRINKARAAKEEGKMAVVQAHLKMVKALMDRDEQLNGIYISDYLELIEGVK